MAPKIYYRTYKSTVNHAPVSPYAGIPKKYWHELSSGLKVIDHSVRVGFEKKKVAKPRLAVGQKKEKMRNKEVECDLCGFLCYSNYLERHKKTKKCFKK